MDGDRQVNGGGRTVAVKRWGLNGEIVNRAVYQPRTGFEAGFEAEFEARLGDDCINA